MSFDLSSHKTQLVLTALAASAATAGVISAYTAHTRAQKRRTLNDDVLRSLAAAEHKGKAATLSSAVPPPPVPGAAAPALQGAYSEELIREQLALQMQIYALNNGLAPPSSESAFSPSSTPYPVVAGRMVHPTLRKPCARAVEQDPPYQYPCAWGV